MNSERNKGNPREHKGFSRMTDPDLGWRAAAPDGSGSRVSSRGCRKRVREVTEILDDSGNRMSVSV